MVKRFLCGVLEGIRTPDPLVRSQILYPTELQAHIILLSEHKIYNNTKQMEMQEKFSKKINFFEKNAVCDKIFLIFSTHRIKLT